MTFRRNSIASWLALLLIAYGVSPLLAQPYPLGEHFWPTSTDAFAGEESAEAVIQPTASGRLSSGLYGCVRNGGRRFHEGVDIKATQWDKWRESTDTVYAFGDGIVRHVSRVAGHSSYGRYVVIEHVGLRTGLVSLYAHLRSIPSSIVPGTEVRGGEPIGILGRSANHTIPRSRAHLHFEFGYWLGGDFQKWYDRQGFGSKNRHGAFNGMNIIGMDTWRLLNALYDGEVKNALEFIEREPIALEAIVPSATYPAALSAQPELMTQHIVPEDFAGWRIGYTADGLPKEWTAITAKELGDIDTVSVDVLEPELFENCACMGIAVLRKSGGGSGGVKLFSQLDRMFFIR